MNASATVVAISVIFSSLNSGLQSAIVGLTGSAHLARILTIDVVAAAMDSKEDFDHKGALTLTLSRSREREQEQRWR
jgi:hypothetical protein